MGTVVLFLVGLIIYFIPGIVGNSKRNSDAIWVLNILLGWTLIGWVVALVWACTADPPTNHYNFTPTAPQTKITKVEELERLKSLRDSGVLTDSEFAKEKERILRG